MGLFLVDRLEEADSLLKEGGVWVSAGALRACSYKAHPKPKLQGEAPRLFKGFILVFVFSVATWVVTKEANETMYWLELLHETEYITRDMYDSLYHECVELFKLLTSIIKTTKSNYKL